MTFTNQVILTGKVVNPPRPYYRPDGSPVIQFPLELDDSEDRATQAMNHAGSRQARHRTGSGQGAQKRITIVAFGKLAEFKFDLLQSGQRLMVVGKLNQRRWQTPEGKNRTCTEVIATELRTIEEKNPTLTSKK
jgi:single-stranded DNA-binding protein